MKNINYMQPSFDESEIKAVTDYMNSGGWITEFIKTREFEESIRMFTNAEYCSVMSNGTVTLLAALMACDLKPGDEVIVPDFTMSATAHVVEILGAKAVFVDIEKDTLCMDFECMKRAVTEKTKAVMVVHLNGRYPSKFMEMIEFCKDNSLWLIEDAAQALGSTYEGKALGTFGDIGSFSFSMPKIITTGQGGAIITNNSELYEKILKIRDFGREKAGSDHYLMIGANFKFTDLQAVVGIEQMKKLPYRLERKKEMGELYEDRLKDMKQVQFVHSNYDEVAPCFFELLCNEGKDELISFLKERGIQTRKFYPPLHKEPAYNYTNLRLPVSEEISLKGIWLPSSILVSDEQIDYICSNIRSFYQE